MQITKYFFISLLVLTLFACSTNKISGRTQLNLISDQEVFNISNSMYQNDKAIHIANNRLNADKVLLERVKKITDRLISATMRLRPYTLPWPWEMNVVHLNKLNAYCMAGGKMMIYTGIIHELNLNDDEIATVIAHEISHAVLDHSKEKMSIALASQIGVTLVGIASGFDENQSQIAHEVVKYAVLLPNSRAYETEADTVGIKIQAMAGFNPKAASGFWHKVQKYQAKTEFDFFSTHPSNTSRIINLKNIEKEMMPIYQEALKSKVNSTEAIIPFTQEGINKTNLYKKSKYEY